MTSALSPAEALEAASRRYARDTFRLRRLESGRWCIYDADGTPLGATDTIEGIALLAQPLSQLAAAARANFEAEAADLRRRAAERREAESLDLSDLELDLDI